ncbi:WD40-repeat-containing domain protein [Naematelia encephala]|uniref:WD40-repeat-containing domain protein n=1 Tax=Naematelia encephala TaxID=71784 RepID=A0A1Y2B3Y6_9TREE|nr:WD40-repeat-containing domain protein [Naematelia encephala]
MSQAGPSKLKFSPLPPSSAPPTITSFPSFAGASSAAPSMEDNLSYDEAKLDVIPTRAGRKLCVRHKQMANQNVNEKLQRSLDSLPTSERSAVTQLWSTFSNAPHNKRKLILEGILTMCCFSQLSHLSDSLNLIIRIDPFSLLPRETSLRILGHLDAFSLGKAAQVSKSWKALADDDLLWRRMCGQHIDRKCEKCGWGLPLLERRRLKVELKDRSPAAAMGVGQHDHDHDHEHGHAHAGPSKMVTRLEALGGKAPDLQFNLSCDPVQAPPNPLKRSAPDESVTHAKKAKFDSDSDGEGSSETVALSSREVRLTRPWKTVYCERLVVERNWRKGRCVTKTLNGHTDGVMCLQYHTTLSSPSYPVLITGSYDRTVRIWNLDTGLEVRQLRGHTRAVRCLQFDQMLLFTGAMDGTVRMWNWRAGECLRVLEGHTDGVVCLNYNGYLLASGSADSTIQVWNFRTGNKITLRGHEDWVNSVVLWDGKTSPGDMDPSKPPSFSTAAARSKSPGPDELDKKQPDLEPGAMLFSASDDGTIKLWDLATETCIRTFEGHKAQVQTMKVIMVDMSDSEIQQAQRQQRQSSTPPNGLIPASQIGIASLSNGTTNGGVPEGFDPEAHRSRSRNVNVVPKVYVHDKATKERSPSMERNDKKPLLVTGSLDGTVKLWDVETGVEKSTLFGHIEGVWAVDIDGLHLVSASHDRTIKVWERDTGTCAQTLVGHRGAVTSLQLSDDMIVSGSDDGGVMVWNFGPNQSGGTIPNASG